MSNWSAITVPVFQDHKRQFLSMERLSYCNSTPVPYLRLFTWITFLITLNHSRSNMQMGKIPFQRVKYILTFFGPYKWHPFLVSDRNVPVSCQYLGRIWNELRNTIITPWTYVSRDRQITCGFDFLAVNFHAFTRNSVTMKHDFFQANCCIFLSKMFSFVHSSSVSDELRCLILCF